MAHGRSTATLPQKPTIGPKEVDPLIQFQMPLRIVNRCSTQEGASKQHS